MITTKENGTQYPTLTEDIINFHLDNNLTIAYVERGLTFQDGEYIDDITDAEVQAGYEKVREFYYRQISDPLFFKYQRGEIDKQVWLDAILEIKDRYK
jgi:hypothetical protein